MFYQRLTDESVSVENHRDRILHLIKSLSPKLVTLVEQESNTNTSPFLSRFVETLGYYTAMFESIDAARPRDDKLRISAEQHCVARDIVNMIASEEAERVERHEVLEKWRVRMMMAGFMGWPVSHQRRLQRVRCLKVTTKTINLEGVKEHSIFSGRGDPWLHVLLGSQTRTRLCRTDWTKKKRHNTHICQPVNF